MKPADPIRDMAGQLPAALVDLITNSLPALLGLGASVVLLGLAYRSIRGLSRD